MAAEFETDVLVVGAGPVGLLMAVELARSGVRTTIVERAGDRSYFCKALGVSARTLEVFDDLGIAQDAVDRGMWLRGMSVFLDGAVETQIEIPPLLSFGALSLAQYEVESLLEGALHRHGGRVRYGVALESLRETAEGVEATLRTADGAAETLACRWLVGCDGAHSSVRKALDLPFEGERFPQTFALADIDIEWDFPRGHFYRINTSAKGDRPGTTLVAVPVAGSPKRYRLSTDFGSAPPAEETPSLEMVRELMLPMLPAGTGISALHWSSMYHISHRIVPHYGKGRVFVAGDAAHIHPPVGGLGMNTGLQDAHNLAWKLTLAVSGRDAPGLLASYHAERHPVGLDVVESTSRALNESLAQRVPMPGIRETQLLIGYRGSPIVAPAPNGAEIAAGDRIADVEGLRRTYVAAPLRLSERLGEGRHVLFGVIERQEDLAPLAALADRLTAVLGDSASAFAVAPAGFETPVDPPVPVLLDAEGTFAAEFGFAPGTTCLARPDRHFAWIGATPSREDLDVALARIARLPA